MIAGGTALTEVESVNAVVDGGFASRLGPGSAMERWAWPLLALSLALLAGLWLAGPANAAPGEIWILLLAVTAR